MRPFFKDDIEHLNTYSHMSTRYMYLQVQIHPMKTTLTDVLTLVQYM